VEEKLFDLQMKIILIIRTIVFVIALMALGSGLWLGIVLKEMIPIAWSMLLLGCSWIFSIYRFNNDLKNNKITQKRTIGYFFIIGRGLFLSLGLDAFLRNDIKHIIFYLCLVIFFVVAQPLYLFLYAKSHPTNNS
jgi:hypothetical protein